MGTITKSRGTPYTSPMPQCAKLAQIIEAWNLSWRSWRVCPAANTQIRAIEKTTLNESTKISLMELVKLLKSRVKHIVISITTLLQLMYCHIASVYSTRKQRHFCTTALLDVRKMCDFVRPLVMILIWMTVLRKKKNVTCYNQMIVARADVLTSFIFIFTNDNR
jgi:hypothetical protein